VSLYDVVGLGPPSGGTGTQIKHQPPKFKRHFMTLLAGTLRAEAHAPQIKRHFMTLLAGALTAEAQAPQNKRHFMT